MRVYTMADVGGTAGNEACVTADAICCGVGDFQIERVGKPQPRAGPPTEHVWLCQQRLQAQ